MACIQGLMANFGASSPTPRELILDVLAVAESGPVPTAALLEAGSILNFSQTATRVAIARLSQSKLIESPERSRWKLSDRTAWSRERNRWREVNALIRDWDGTWLLAVTSDVARSDRPERNRNERALRHRGFREVHRDLFMRPDNLCVKMPLMRHDLVNLGASKKLIMIRATELDFIPSLKPWDIKANQSQLRDVMRLIKSLSHSSLKANNDEICRSFWFAARRAVRLLNNDPLLPDSMSTAALRDQLLAELPAFIDKAGRYWRERLGLV